MNIKQAIDIKNNCYGCMACINACPFGAISFTEQDKGFLFPGIADAKCRDCGRCVVTCPAVNGNLKHLFHNANQQQVYSIRHPDRDIRLSSSSGGLFTLLSDYVLKNNGVVFGAVWDESLSVVHTYALDFNTRDKMKLSKYVQSNIGNTYGIVRRFLSEGKLVLFTGTPCQIAGLRLFLGGKCENARLITCDVLCGGNVSPGLFHAYIKFIENKYKDRAKAVSFRTKKLGWKQHHIKVELNTGTYEGARKDNEPFFSMYLGKLSIRESCFHCGFACHERVSDLTMGDFWGINEIDPDTDDDTGISLGIVNTQKGYELIDCIKGQCIYEERSMEIAEKRQLNLRGTPLKSMTREKFWNTAQNLGYEAALKKYTTFGKGKYIKNKITSLIRDKIRYYKNRRIMF